MLLSPVFVACDGAPAATGTASSPLGGASSTTSANHPGQEAAEVDQEAAEVDQEAAEVDQEAAEVDQDTELTEKTPERPIKPIAGIEYIIAISVDGLGSFYLTEKRLEGLPHLRRLKKQGSCTFAARADKTHTITLPNHSSMLTGLPVSITSGLLVEQAHGYILNSLPARKTTLHNAGNLHRSYTPSVFDVVHDQGLKTALYATKDKFLLFEQSYNAAGASDVTRDDNGRRKIDSVLISTDHAVVVARLVDELKTYPAHFTFLHLAAPDVAGHAYGWGSDAYYEALRLVDGLLGQLLTTIDEEAVLTGRTAILLTSDHGGVGSGHYDSTLPVNYTIPFFVWAPGFVDAGDLYESAGRNRLRPDIEENPPYTQSPPVIRNADIGNASLEMLGLPLIPGSVTLGLGL